MQISTASPWLCSLLLTACVFTGCGSRDGAGGASATTGPERHHENDGHDHSAGEHSQTGPHGGDLIELGSDEAFHAELLHDDKNHRVTVYILDGKAKVNVPISQPELVVNVVSGGNPMQFKLAAVSQANELRDMASCFQTQNEELSTALDATDCKGRLAVNISGKQYVGEIEHHQHDDHDKEHHEHK